MKINLIVLFNCSTSSNSYFFFSIEFKTHTRGQSSKPFSIYPYKRLMPTEEGSFNYRMQHPNHSKQQKKISYHKILVLGQWRRMWSSIPFYETKLKPHFNHIILTLPKNPIMFSTSILFPKINPNFIYINFISTIYDY